MRLRWVLGRTNIGPLASVTMRDGDRIEGELSHTRMFFLKIPLHRSGDIPTVMLLTPSQIASG